MNKCFEIKKIMIKMLIEILVEEIPSQKLILLLIHLIFLLVKYFDVFELYFLLHF